MHMIFTGHVEKEECCFLFVFFKNTLCKYVNQTEALVYNPFEMCSHSCTASLFVNTDELQLSKMMRSH